MILLHGDRGEANRPQTHIAELWELLAKSSYVNSIHAHVHFNVNVVFIQYVPHCSNTIYYIYTLKMLGYFYNTVTGSQVSVTQIGLITDNPE